jgi:hypothetical protein
MHRPVKIVLIKLDPFYDPLHNAALKFPEVALPSHYPSVLPLFRGLSPSSWRRRDAQH